MHIRAVINFAGKLYYMWLSYCWTKLFNSHTTPSTNNRSSNNLSIRKSNIFVVVQCWRHFIDAVTVMYDCVCRWLEETRLRKNQRMLINDNDDDECNGKYDYCKRIDILNKSIECENNTRTLCQNKLQLLGSANQIDRLFRCRRRFCDASGHVMSVEARQEFLTE